ncbi:MAG TPA: peptidylprolyl isomerase [Candidatus Nitrosotalea sp.]|nr:peptidylprolyl isomerase [Candidatus Nitrosotalea sp.]
MLQDAKLFSVRKFDFHLRHLLVIGILIISFSISALVRSQAADYGFQLNEFDPFFNYRATQYLVDNGLNAYVHWHDDMSWYPTGRDVFATAQVPLHLTDAALYKIFGGGMSLYDFTIIFPVVFGSMTAIVIFALVRVLGGTSAGLFASLFFALSPPIIVRGTIGWFKSEPLGLFYGLLGVYLFLSGLKSENKKIAISKLVGGGFFLAVGFASWGGIEFFLLPLGLFFIALPFIRKDHKFLLWAVPLFVAVTMVIAGGLFARPGPTFVFGMRGFAMIGPAILLVIIILVQKYSKEQHRIRNSLLALAALIIIGLVVLSVGSSHSVSFRYLNAMNPFLTSEDPLVDSVAEHATPTLAQNFSYFSVLMLFAGLGIWLVFRKRNGDPNASRFSIKNEMIVFALIIGIVGAYSGSTFSRLELLTATSVIVLSSIGLAILIKDILKRQNTPVKFVEPSKKGTGSKKEIPTKKTNELLGRIPKIAFVAVIVALLLVPTLYPVNANWISITKSPPTILNGGSNFAISTSDWPDALNWIKNNTPKDSVVASWWDYGYWVQTLGERKTLADNSTVDTNTIANIARMLLDSPDEAWKALKNMGANYVLVYVVGQKFVSNGQDLYILGGGGDESKKQWFMKIGGLDSTKFLQDDSFTPTDYFWSNTLLGKMFPFTPLTYYDPNTHNESPTYTTGYTAIYSKTIKYDANSNGPLRLVYSSPSLDRKDSGVFSGVLIYQVNPDYKSSTASTTTSTSQGNSSSTTTPATTTAPTTTTTPSGGNIAVISTKFGDIKFRLFDNVAPKTTANFIKLANSGFYDKTVFHRIMPGFVIQGGDPNTIKGDRSTWGLGDAGYTIPPEFSSTLNFTKYMVGMARGNDVNSGSSQFFITVGDAPWLNDQYTLFGQVVSGQDVVDKIASLKTDPTTNQPVDAETARVNTITIESSNSTK